MGPDIALCLGAARAPGGRGAQAFCHTHARDAHPIRFIEPGARSKSLDRADRVHRAMLARGYDGEVRTLVSLQMRVIDVLFLIGNLFFMGLVVAVTHMAGAMK